MKRLWPGHMGRGKEDREGGGGTRAASVPTFSGGANVFPTTPQGSIASAGADASCPLFPLSSGTKTRGTGREGPVEHLGMSVRGGLAGRLPVWQIFQRTGPPTLLQVAGEKGTLKSLGLPAVSQILSLHRTAISDISCISYIRQQPRAQSPSCS